MYPACIITLATLRKELTYEAPYYALFSIRFLRHRFNVHVFILKQPQHKRQCYVKLQF